MSKTLSVSPETLVARARTAMMRAYAPYSHHYVGAALLAADGSVWEGCNIENAAYSPSVCAERTALFSAVAAGVRDFAAIAIVGGRLGQILDVFPPCGVCRQVLAEFVDPDAFLVILGGPEGHEIHTLRELLPRGFFPSALRTE